MEEKIKKLNEFARKIDSEYYSIHKSGFYNIKVNNRTIAQYKKIAKEI